MSTTKIANSERQFAQAIHCQSFVKLPIHSKSFCKSKMAVCTLDNVCYGRMSIFRFYRVNLWHCLAPTVQVRTTLLRSLLKLVPLSSGSITLGKDIRVGYVPQLKDFAPKLPIQVGTLVQRWGWMGKIICLVCLAPKNLRRFWQTAKQKNIWWIKPLRKSAANHFVMHRLPCSRVVSSSMRIAQALVAEPDVLLMDEPLLSLDVASQYVVSDILAHRKQAHHTAILMISHELEPIIPLR